MAITNLTNTRWIINQTPVYDQYCEARGSIDSCWWRVDFYATTVDSSANRFNSLSLTNYRSDPVPADIGMMVYSKTSGADVGVYDNDRTPHWYQGDDMRTITITGGEHVEDTNLINWLGANATQVPGLANTRWKWHDRIYYEDYLDILDPYGTQGTALIGFPAYTNVKLYTGDYLLANGLEVEAVSGEQPPCDISTLKYDYETSSGDPQARQGYHWNGSEGVWNTEDDKIFTFTTGNILYDSNFIAWIQDNADQIFPDLHITYGSDEVDRWSPHTLKTAGRLMSSNIVVESLGGGSVISNRPTVTVTPTATTQTVTYDSSTYTGIESVIVNGVVPSFTNAATASSNNSGIRVTVAGTTYNISTVTVPSGKSLTVVNGGTANVTNTGITNINGGNTNRGVQVSDKLAIVDGYTVTDNNGDLLTPTYNSTTKALTYPAAYTVAGTTAQYTLSGDVTSINGALVRDTTAVSGSGTASSSYSNTYLAKWNSATTLSTGPHITISTSTPGSASGAAGDIWYQVL